jgi:hypothetical protein
MKLWATYSYLWKAQLLYPESRLQGDGPVPLVQIGKGTERQPIT